jgi:hypothetical protein
MRLESNMILMETYLLMYICDKAVSCASMSITYSFPVGFEEKHFNPNIAFWVTRHLRVVRKGNECNIGG